MDRQIPFLGICLGLQLMFESSEETPGVEGLHLLDGKIRRIPAAEELKIPHIGWNDLTFPNEGRLFRGVEEHSYVYLYIPIIWRQQILPLLLPPQNMEL